MDKRQKIEEAFERMEHCQIVSEYLRLNDSITEKKLAVRKNYVNLEPGEKPLFMVDTIRTGLVVTDRSLYYKCMKIKLLFRSISMFMSSRNMGKIALDDIHEISIGKPVFDMTTYCGHRFSINGQVVGTLILGGAYTFDENLVENLELLFKALV